MIHLIKKQELRLTIGRGVESFRVQHAASRYYQDRLLPLLERVFDELGSEREVVRIDRLVIDIGPITEKALLAGESDERFYAVIRQEVLRVMRDRETEVGIRSESMEMNALMQWWYYMEKGRLPWNATGITADWHRRVLEMLAVSHQHITRLRTVLMSSPVFLQRVSFQHRDVFLETLAGILTGVRMAPLPDRVEALCRLAIWLERGMPGSAAIGSAGSAVPSGSGASAGSAPVGSGGSAGPTSGGGSDKSGGSGGWAGSGASAGSDGSGASGESSGAVALVDSIRRWKDRHAGFLQLQAAGRKAAIWRMVLREAAMRPVKLQEVQHILRQWLIDDTVIRRGLAGSDFEEWMGGDTDLRDERGVPARKDAGADVFKPGKQAAGVGGESPVGGSERPGGSQRPEESAVEDVSKVVEGTGPGEDGLFLANSGLILIHPFLTTLFTRIGWWDGRSFSSPEDRQRAVFLLHFLATGERETDEHVLVFPKLLCGYGLETPLPGSVDLPDAVCDEGMELLQQVLERWEKLKNSSIGSLREGFLQRPGKLISRQGRLILLMEMSAIDVLLDYLPWNIGVVKLPWAKDLLYTEWR